MVYNKLVPVKNLFFYIENEKGKPAERPGRKVWNLRCNFLIHDDRPTAMNITVSGSFFIASRRK